PEYSLDMARLGLHPIAREQVPPRFFDPKGASIGTQNAIVGTSPDVVSQTTASAFSVLMANFTPAETINLSLNGGAPTGFAANADGRAFVRVTTGTGLGYITVEAIGQTSGKRSGSVVQVLDNPPYVPCVTAGPHAVNNSVASSAFSLYSSRL